MFSLTKYPKQDQKNNCKPFKEEPSECIKMTGIPKCWRGKNLSTQALNN